MTKKLLVLVAVAAITVAATVSFANHNASHKVQKAGPTSSTVVVTGEDTTTINTNNWTTINGATARVRVPDGGRALILARFTSEAVCYNIPIDHCAMRIQIDQRSAHPASGRDFHIDSHYGDETEESEKGRAFDRSLEVGPGRYKVRVQGTAMGGTIMKIDDWSLTVKRAKT